MKQGFSSLDLSIVAKELHARLESLRVANIYDLSSRIFLIKFRKPDLREDLIIESGFRCHLSSYSRNTASSPSAFVSRLRHYLKTKRVTSVSQVGTDRILEIQFSDGRFRLFLEFYAQGNIVLTDTELKIIALLRNVTEGQEHEQIKLGVEYNLSQRQNVAGAPLLSEARLRNGLENFILRQTGAESQKQRKKSKAKDQYSLRKALSSCTSEFPPALLEHSLRVEKFDTSKTPADVLQDDEAISALMNCLNKAANVVSELKETQTVRGYIIAQEVNSTQETFGAEGEERDLVDGGEQAKNVLRYNEFHPFKPEQFADDTTWKILEFEGFNNTVDEFFSAIEGQKLESRLQDRKDNARKKLEKTRQDQNRRLHALQSDQELNVRKAETIEANLERVREATEAINGLIAQGMDWGDMNALIDLEQKRRNPVAETIKLPLNLHENTATLLLGEADYEANEDDKEDLTESEPSDSEGAPNNSNSGDTKPNNNRLEIDIDLGLSAWSNAREYYDQKKTAAAKKEKTAQAAAKALKSAEKKIGVDLQRSLKEEKDILRPVRNQLWFEKFIYFVSSDGYLVLGGRDVQQNDLLYRKHLKKADVYVTADIEGAAFVIVKNNTTSSDSPIPPSTLAQAGTLSVSTSKAWDSKAVMPAWWVKAEQVSKIDATGDLLGQGRFHITGEKSFLPPSPLLLGFAVIFQISDESKARHTKHRLQAKPTVLGDTTASSPLGDVSTARLTSELSSVNLADEESPADDVSSATSDRVLHDEEDGVEHVNPLQNNSSDVQCNKSYDTNASDMEPPSAYTSNDAIDIEEQLSEKGAEDEAVVGGPDKMASISGEDGIDDSSTLEEAKVESSAVNSTKGQAIVRGKRGKRKKIATKYADQDEEDRVDAMRALGSKSGQEKVASESQAKKAKEEEAVAQKQRRREQHERAAQIGKEAEEQRKFAQEHSDEEDKQASAVDLNTLVGTPLPGDEILEAIPVCAPWNALAQYKYKAKLQPGSQKKGKAVREILANWNRISVDRKNVDDKAEDVEKSWPRELDLIKAWKESEVFNIVPVSKVRLMISGSNVKGGKAASKGKAKSGKGSKKGH